MSKRKKNISILIAARDEFAGIGTRKTKLRLNKLAKTSIYAKALRLALEAEDANLTAKRYFGGDVGGYSYSQIHYFHKSESIEALINVAQSQNWVYGVQPSDAPGASHVIYFDIPGVQQLSWHLTPTGTLPSYPGSWDRQENSTLMKLETAIRPVLEGTLHLDTDMSSSSVMVLAKQAAASDSKPTAEP